MAPDATTTIVNLPDYLVISVSVLADGRRQVIVETDQPPGCPTCGVVAMRRKERRLQRIRDIPVAGTVEVFWPKYRLVLRRTGVCQALVLRIHGAGPGPCPVHRLAPDHIVDAVIRSGRAVLETFAVSWGTVRAALIEACFLTLPEIDALSPRMLRIAEHRFRSVRYFRDPSPLRGSGTSRG